MHLGFSPSNWLVEMEVYDKAGPAYPLLNLLGTSGQDILDRQASTRFRGQNLADSIPGKGRITNQANTGAFGYRIIYGIRRREASIGDAEYRMMYEGRQRNDYNHRGRS